MTSLENHPILELRNVGKSYEAGIPAVEGINLEVTKGELIVLVGTSGCGKTTLLKMCNRLISVSEGKILFNGRDVYEMNEIELRRNIGYVIQQVGLFPHMSIEENIAYVLMLKGWNKSRSSSRVSELLELVGLPEDMKRRKPSGLSGGQQQRVGVARALAADPELVLMDEPFGALDPLTRLQLQLELKKLQTTICKTVIFVTHDMQEAVRLADRVAIMKDGRLLQIGSPIHIFFNPVNEFVESFFNQAGNADIFSVISVKDAVSFTENTIFYDEFDGFQGLTFDMYAIIDRATGRLVGVADKSLGKFVPKEELPLIRVDMNVSEAVGKLFRHGLVRMPVVSENDRFVGFFDFSSAYGNISN